MTLIGLDLNATRARAVQGPMQSLPLVVRLEDEHPDLPLALNLAERRPVAGRAGLALGRKLPHLAVLDFLPHLGHSKAWAGGRHKLDAGQALGLVFERLQRALSRGQGTTFALPAYLQESQLALVAQAAQRCRLNVLGSVPTPLAAVRQVYPQRPWSGLALVGDVDGAGLSWSVVSTDGGHGRVLESRLSPRLARGAWVMQMLDAVAHRCIRLSRRDPRQVPDTEQALFDRLSGLLDAPAGAGLVEINLRTPQWSQHLLFQPAELAASCAGLVQQAVAALRDCVAALPLHGAVHAVLLTAAAGNLPGLTRAVELATQGEPGPRAAEEPADFGEALLQHDRLAPGEVLVLEPDAVAAGAHDLAGLMYRCECPRGHADTVPLPLPEPVEAGPARLEFRGQEHPLSGAIFTIGRDPACNLVIEGDQYPTVAPRHCDIMLDHRVYSLFDRSRQGTLVNERPVSRQVSLRSGDWIRLGPDGPVLRFLGEPVALRPFRHEE
jgi:hypothetical protein